MKIKIIIVIIAGFLILVLALQPEKTSVLQETDSFIKSMSFIYFDRTLYHLDISTESRFHSGPRLFTGDTVPAFPGAPAAIYGDSLYVGADNILYEFDRSFNVRRQMCISEFGFDPSIYRFGPRAQTFEGMLWMTVCHDTNPEHLPLYHRVIQWDTTAPPETRKVSPKYKLHRRWAVDVTSNILYIPSGRERDTLRYSFDTGQVEHKAYGLYTDADIQNNMLLLSIKVNPRLRNYPIALIDLDTDERTFLDTGALARWGSEGVIYYCKGTTHLWQMDIADQQPQRLYRATRFPSYRARMANIELSQSKRHLSFVYTKPKLLSDESRFIIVDLQEGTYRTFPRTYIGTFSVALWESDQMDQADKQVKADDIHTD